ncbi:ferredoxin-type protein NapF [Thalassotalea insulae]|uniref:Ferredoxin-type protein NapF n=1 Tax=Thalassotalea insulae TaxID=2056778 RepID=A0ABQ6GUP1_9GAMM|nr:ferredoxin-type protein NapF [Thalassotalea insulae]GLX79650.1 ferredoxin-type protein NapF [Thalassotalea insulae]
MSQQLENPSRRRLFRGKLAPPAPKLRLPWIKSEQHFTEHCTQCGDCLAACETKILIKDEAGFPTVDFNLDECTFCGQCQVSCQQPLFIDKQQQDNGKQSPWLAKLTIDNQCLAQNNILCQSCQDVCDTNAITFDFSRRSVPAPEVDLSACNQCGACISTCPQQAIELTPKTVEVNYA